MLVKLTPVVNFINKQLLFQYSFEKKITELICNKKKLRKTHLFEKGSSKMLMKLTNVVSFIRNLQVAFAVILFCQKIPSQVVIREKERAFKTLVKLTLGFSASQIKVSIVFFHSKKLCCNPSNNKSKVKSKQKIQDMINQGVLFSLS